LPLIVQDQGARIGKKGEEFEIITRQDKYLVRMADVSQVCIMGNIQMTTQALREAVSRDIPVCYFSMGGWFYAIVQGLSHKNVNLRIMQYRTADNFSESMNFARHFVAAKISNQRTILMRNHPDLPESVPKELRNLALSARTADCPETLLCIEGFAAKLYFSHFGGLLSGDEGFGFNFSGRNRRPPTDPVNAMLSYAYSLLAKDVSIALLSVGFDPFLGFYHRPRYGRVALALDMMEEFRPIYSGFGCFVVG
jgi:CRISPR-associated protein Cas1